MESVFMRVRCKNGPYAFLKVAPAVMLACTLGLANAAVYSPDNFAAGGGTNLETMVMVKDGSNRLLVGGLFNTVEGQSGYQGVARYNTDDSLDTAFKVATDDFVKAIAVQPDGKILIGGQFHWVRPAGSASNTTIWGIARLNADGTLDNSFLNAPAGSVKSNHNVRGIAVQPDGKIVIGGYFTLIDGVARNRIARLNANGTLDTTFNVGVGANGNVEDVKLQPDGKILISGSFTSVQGTTIWGVARLNANGSLDTTFVPNAAATGSINGAWDGNFPVYQIALQADGKILINGGTLRYASEVHRGIVRLNANGTPDTSFNAALNDWGTSVALQTVGGEQKIVVGGGFTVVGQRNTATDAVVGTDVVRQGIARFNADGTPDTTFDTSNGADAWVWAVLPNGADKVYLGGKFNNVGGQVRHGVARLAALNPSSQIINFPAPSPATYTAPGAFSWTAGATSTTGNGSAGSPVTYTSVNPTVCSVNSTTGVVSLPNPVVTGECTIEANAAAGATNQVPPVPYDAASPVRRTKQIYAAGTQAITFPAQASSHQLEGGPFPISPVATASSGLPVTYTSLTPAVCTVSNGTPPTVTPVAAGECVIAADQPGNGTYSAAPRVTRSTQLRSQAAEATAQPTPVPALGPLGLGLLSLMGAGVGALSLRRRKNVG